MVDDFKTWVETSGSSKLGGGHEAVGEAEMSGNYDSVDGLAEPVSIKKKKVHLPDVRSRFSGRYRYFMLFSPGGSFWFLTDSSADVLLLRMIKGDTLKLLKLKEKDKLAVVYETVYNSGAVTIISKRKKDGCISASFNKMANLFFKASKKCWQNIFLEI